MNESLFLRLLAVLAVAVVMSSCAVTSQKVVENGEEFHYVATTNPIDTAWCMGRAAQEMHSLWKPRIRPLDPDGTMEFVVKAVVGLQTTGAVAHLKPIANGSDVMLWINREPPIVGRNTLRERLVGGCSML